MNLLTIVTVNKNSGSLLKKTSESIKKILKERSDITWLIIDNMSRDYSYKIMQDLKKKSFSNNIQIIREEDEGIYNAMNKGINLSTSKFILFINSGDTIYKDNLKIVLEQNKNKNINLICNFKILNHKKNLKYFLIKIFHALQIYFRLSLPSSHNSIIYLTEHLKKSPFNEIYKYGADYSQYLDLKANKKKFINLRMFKITELRDDGYIFRNKKNSYLDYAKINLSKLRIFGYIYWKIRYKILILLRSF